MRDNYINVCLATDNNYALPSFITMSSVEKNTERFINFFILASSDIEDKFVSLWKERFNNEKSKLTIFKMDNQYDKNQIRLPHVTTATFFRAEIPELLKKENKCFYLDSDIVVCQNIDTLYDEDIDDYYCAGVKDLYSHFPEDLVKKRSEMLNIKNYDFYINAGMILLNLDLIRSDKKDTEMKELFKQNFPFPSQDPLNKAFNGRVKLLKPKYNLFPKCLEYTPNEREKENLISASFSKEEWDDAINNPVIIHYNNEKKPWKYAWIYNGYKWWNVFNTESVFLFSHQWMINYIDVLVKQENKTDKILERRRMQSGNIY